MKVEFADDRLSLIRTKDAHKLGLPISVIKAACRKLILLDSALDERDLWNWTSFHYKKLSGDREGQRSIRINDQYRIIFVLDEEEKPPCIRVLEIDDIH